MRSLAVVLFTFIFIFTAVKAAPIPRPFSLSDIFGSNDDTEDATGVELPQVSNNTIRSSFLRPAFYARLAYCSTESVTNLSCGGPCDALTSSASTTRRQEAAAGAVKILTAGGDGGAVPQFFVALDSTEGEGNAKVVVSHQGTDPGNFLSVLNDVEFALEPASNTSFPSSISFTATNDDNETETVQIHNGFQSTFDRTSSIVLSTILSALDSETKPKKLLFTGHSLGAAISLLDSLFIHDALATQGIQDIEIETVVFGLPRVGNTAFASLIDSLPLSLTHITNQNDPVPLLPPRFAGFTHPANEVHINKVDETTGQAQDVVACPGTENDQCSDGGTILKSVDGGIQDHLGPYFDDISFGGNACPA